MIDLKQKNNVFILEFTKNDVSEEFLIKLLRKYKADKLLFKNEMTDDDAWSLSEEIKEDWFKNNKQWILEKVGDMPSECDS